jgi:ubiquinone/menaquinone biosynthesis C-methylase UbiE
VSRQPFEPGDEEIAKVKATSLRLALVGPSEFNRASHAVWEAMAPGWEKRHDWFETATRPVAERMLQVLRMHPGDTLLELAAGTGVVGFTAMAALGGDARLIISDFAAAMVEAARRRGVELGFERVEYRVLDAEALELQDESVDGVLCRWGYMLLADPTRALAETRRVLRDGGRVSCAVFAEPAKNPWAALPTSVLVESGRLPSPEPGQPGILALADTTRLRQLFRDARLTDPEVEEVPFAFRFSGETEYWRFLTDMAGAISMTLAHLDDEARAEFRANLTERLEPYRVSNGLELPAVSLVVAATRG